jgi:glycine betaine/choline ABC-type transport system substrate-binding protein
VGSKNFTESVILGELLAQHLERLGYPVDRRLNLGGTFICHEAIVNGQIDAYVEYTGTAYGAVLQSPLVSDRERVTAIVDSAYDERWNLEIGPPLGFDNTFALLVRGADARRLGIATLSEAAAHTGAWRPGFGYEFMERADGYRGLVSTYGLSFERQPTVMDLGLTYRALAEGEVDIIAGNSTDGQIEALDLFHLADDRAYFPPYEALAIFRFEAAERHAGLREALAQLGGTIDAPTMRHLNYLVDVEKRDYRSVVGTLLDSLAAAGSVDYPTAVSADG